MSADTDANSRPGSKSILRGAELQSSVQYVIRQHYADHGTMPTKTWMLIHHGISHYAATKYWISADDIQGDVNGPTPCPAVSPAGKVGENELVQVIAEMVFGDALISGTYVGADGRLHCDIVTMEEGTCFPHIRKWRHHERDVAQILALAKELV